MVKRNYWQNIKETLLSNKVLILTILFITVLSYGFTITNFSIGIDDPLREYYLYSRDWGSQIQQGRITQVILNYLTDAVDFIPFFTDFLGACLFAVSALLFCGLLQYVTDNHFSTFSLAVFCCIYISYPINADKFIFQLDVISATLSYCCCAISLVYSYMFVFEKHSVQSLVSAVLFLMISIGSYETFLFLYFCGVFSIFLLRIVICNDKISFTKLILKGMQFAAILVASTIFYYLAVTVLQIVTRQYGVFTRGNIFQLDFLTNGHLFSKFPTFVKTIYNRIHYFASEGHTALQIFEIITVLGAFLFLYLAIRKKNPWVILCFIGLFAGNLLLFLVSAFDTRMCQSFCFYIAFVILILLQQVSPKGFLYKIACILIASLIIRQAATINQVFYTDYKRYQQEAFTIHSIASELIAEYDITKTVVFTNTPDYRYLESLCLPQTGTNVGRSMIYWASEDDMQSAFWDMFKMHGYTFLRKPSAEEYELALQESEDMPSWPNKDAIRELDNIIIVNLG